MDRIREIGENIKNSKCFKGLVKYEEPMSRHTTMKVGGNAAVYVIPKDAVSAALVVKECRENGVRLVVVGGGSNIIVSDDGINGVVLSTEGLDAIGFSLEEKAVGLEGLEWKSGNLVRVNCGAGALMSTIVDFCAENGFLGLSPFSGLPGTAGGAAFMNARCYEKDICEAISTVSYINLDKIPLNGSNEVAETIEIYNNRIEDWSYKKSPFASGNKLIVGVAFDCVAVKGDDVKSFVRLQNDKYVRDRAEKGHFRAPSAGSVFKNNHAFGKPSGKLIDEAGLKGFGIGGAQISSWHGNFIINTGCAKASDIRMLVDTAISRVQERTGFVLEPEIIFI